MNPYEWTGAVFGVLGSLLVALNIRVSAWGFVCYAISNAALVVFGLQQGMSGIVTMNAVFLLMAALGVYRWFFSKAAATH